MTLAGFLEWEERQPLRYEFDGVGPRRHDRRYVWPLDYPRKSRGA